MPLMPFVVGTRAFAPALLACGAGLTLASLYVARVEMRIKPRLLVGTKLLVSALITLVFGAAMLAGAVAYLLRG